jgi:hypothetical protein
MKNIFILLLLLSTLFTGFDSVAQNSNRFPALRERIAQAKLREIRFQLKLNQSAFERFRPIYLRYEREIAQIDFLKQARLMKADTDSLSAEEADQLIIGQLENAKRLVNIREKYYMEFRTVISPQQIIKLYQTEAELRKKVMQEMRKRMMNRGIQAPDQMDRQ